MWRERTSEEMRDMIPPPPFRLTCNNLAEYFKKCLQCRIDNGSCGYVAHHVTSFIIHKDKESYQSVMVLNSTHNILHSKSVYVSSYFSTELCRHGAEGAEKQLFQVE